MINRRLLRIKVLQVFYAYSKRSGDSLQSAEKELLHSIIKTFELFYSLLYLLTDLSDYAAGRIELARNKKIPTLEDLNPNTRFIDNAFINDLKENEKFRRTVELRKINWVQYPELVKNLFGFIIKSEDYQQYMTMPETSFEEDKKFVMTLFSNYFAVSEELDSVLEERSIYWNDDLVFCIEMILKTIKQSKKGAIRLPDEVFKNKEDKDFAITLLRKAIQQKGSYLDLIERFAENWDVERIALMDILIMELAINEMVEFPEIPVKVSLNEYIEISKQYSSSKSGTFINGILDKITAHLRAEKRIVKKGKGLLGEK